MANIYLPKASARLSKPRVYVPESGQSHALEAGLAAGIGAFSKVAEIWRDKKTFESQSEAMAQTLENEGMTQEANLYRASAANASMNFFSDPATNRKANQGLLSDAIKLLQNKQANDLRKEVAQMEIASRVASDERQQDFYTERDRINYERDLEKDRIKAERDANDPIAQERLAAERDRIALAKENAITSRDRLRMQQQDRERSALESEEYKKEMEKERAKGFTVTPFSRGGFITGYSVKDLRGREIRRRGVEIISDPTTGEPILKTETDTTTTTRAEDQTSNAEVDTTLPYLPSGIKGGSDALFPNKTEARSLDDF